MPTLEELINRRIKAASDASAASLREVSTIQALTASEIIGFVADKIVFEEGKMKYTAGNFTRVQGVYSIFERVKRAFKKTMLSVVVDWADRILGANDDYFDSFADVGGIKKQAISDTLLRWGYNVEDRVILPGSYFEKLFTIDGVGQSVASLINRGIANGMTLPEFQRAFRRVFVAPGGAGLLERHWRTNSFDLYQRIDRTANLIYADKLGLNNAIYSGTLEEDSRPFCIARVNKVFNRGEIEGWKKLEFQGKPKDGYNPFTDCGGYNCRHHLSWVSEGVGEKLRAKQN